MRAPFLTRQSVAVMVLLVGVTLTSVSFVATLRGFDSSSILDFRVYRDAVALWLNAGVDPYSIHVTEVALPFTYPPFAVLALAPLAAVSFSVGGVVWLGFTYISTASVALIMWAQPSARRIIKEPRLRYWAAATLTLGVAVQLEPFKATLEYGQINTILMGLVVADCLLVRGKARGFLIGVAIAVKLTPAVFLVWLIWRRDFRAVAVSIGTAITLTAVAWVFLPASTLRYFTSTVFESGRIGWQGYVGNQSLNGMLIRWFGESSNTQLLWVLATVVVFLALVIALRRIRRDRDPAADLLALSLVALFGLLASPISWSHHWVWVVVVAVTALLSTNNVAFASLSALLTVATFVAPMWAAKLPDREVIDNPWQRYVTSNAYVILGLALILSVAVTHPRVAGRVRPRIARPTRIVR